MTSIGEFLEKEIDGKPFHIFTSSSKTENQIFSTEVAIGSGGDNNDLSLLQPSFFCPVIRLEVEEMKLKEKGYSSDEQKVMTTYPFLTPPHFLNTRTIDQLLQQRRDHSSANNDPNETSKHPIVPLVWCNNEEGTHKRCGSCVRGVGAGYFCVTCDCIFHQECVETPLRIKVHPSYPLLSLQLHYSSTDPEANWSCIACEKPVYNFCYHCPTYNLSMHPVCAMKPIPIVIDHTKRHPHPLTFFPKQSSLACDICGIVRRFIPTYVCARCVFVVHQDCIYSPYVIRISRHQHRISFIYSLPSGNFSCGVCRRKVDNNCGAYACNQCDGYFVHSRCALRGDLWDGEELEGVPEEPEIIAEPFQTVADGLILHFSHGHHLQLEIIKVYDENKVCQACVLPIYEGNYYSCVVGCDFILHEKCANASLQIRHQLNGRPLSLKVVTYEYTSGHRQKGRFRCHACIRESCGFVYEGRRGGPGSRMLRLDLQCAFISEPFQYKGHEHPLFLSLTPEEEKSAVCQICEDSRYGRKLSCIECDYIICFKCASLPYKVRYKHDKHFLTFQKVNEASDQSDWCDACEKSIVSSGKGGFYVCDDYCCTSLHVDCLLGKDMYMKHGQTVENNSGEKVHILRNNTMSRPLCDGWHEEQRCPFRVVFKKKNSVYCSFLCT